MTKQPRGIRLNNPGNVRRSDDPWQGLAREQRDRDFFTFESAVHGIRALARTLITYQDRYRLRTIARIINRWAPPRENDTAAYVAAVERYTGVPAEETVDLHRYEDLRPLVEAIIHHENGQQPYTDAQLDKGLALAGVEPPEKPLQASRTVKGAQIATVGTAGAGILGTLAEWWTDALDYLPPWLLRHWWVLLLVTLAGIGLMVWARLDDRRRLAR